MSTTLMIILGVSVLIITLYYFAYLANENNSRRQLQHPAPPPQGYISNPLDYRPRLTAMEEPAPGLSFWPILALAGIAAVFYMGYRSKPAETVNGTSPAYATPQAPDRTHGEVDYDNPEKDAYILPEEKKSTYTVPPSTPRTRTSRWEEKAVDPYEYETERAASEPTKTYEAPDYRKGYGVQIFATEKGWWEEAHVREIQRKYQSHQLLIGTGYTSGQAPVNKFILGPFNTKAEANQFARQAGKAFPGAYAVDLSRLEQVRRYWAVP
ncbi:MAG: SPOR domain-containing protein [Lewinellaceae bacterium]|nr:SPOR domain-containing protein [Phaeodactylibacter sp.]MCB0616172.1 SPOR domain-containing protein [Phaeodactylibacter sp.]MCB9347441.1 SPOR domain-containing protein [Lewinellaceae bacterium]